MRLLTFSFMKNCKLKSILSYGTRKNASSDSNYSQGELIVDKDAGDPSMIEVQPTWRVDEEPVLRVQVLKDMRVFPNFVSEQEEGSLMAELEPQLKRMRYEFDHWDNAIEGFRETERSKWSPENEAVLARVRSLAFRAADEPLDHVHVLDLAAAGHIKPHVDAVRFCGDVIAGVSLLSTAVMRLEHTERPPLALHALLPRRSLYVMRGVARHQFTHAVPGGAAGAGAWRGEPLRRGRRVAVICRSRPAPAARPPPTRPDTRATLT